MEQYTYNKKRKRTWPIKMICVAFHIEYSIIATLSDFGLRMAAQLVELASRSADQNCRRLSIVDEELIRTNEAFTNNGAFESIQGLIANAKCRG